jgi:hypothetical protein
MANPLRICNTGHSDAAVKHITHDAAKEDDHQTTLSNAKETTTLQRWIQLRITKCAHKQSTPTQHEQCCLDLPHSSYTSSHPTTPDPSLSTVHARTQAIARFDLLDLFHCSQFDQ